MFYRLALTGLVASLILAACTGRRGPEPVIAPDGTRAEQVGPVGEWVAEPVALLVIGFDGDGDGTATDAEIMAGLAAAWHRADADGSGVVSPIEFNTWRAHWLGTADGWPGQVTLDRDVDNRITEEEFTEGLARELAHMDKNGDGVLSRRELVRYISAPGRGRPGRGGPARGNGGRRGSSGGGAAPLG